MGGTSVLGKSRKEDEGRTAFALAKEEETDELVFLALLLLETDGLVYGMADAFGGLLLGETRGLLLLGLVDGGTEGGGEGIAVLG